MGKRLAFDSEKGRLWVVCPNCDRWNLSPLEERWEANDEAERAYRDTRKRIATENIGLARLPDGTDLIRIGQPMRPEFAAWRYGDKFGRRMRKQFVCSGGITLVTGGVLCGIISGSALVGFGMIGSAYIHKLWRERSLATVRDDAGIVHRLSWTQIHWATIKTHWMESNVQLTFVTSESQSGPSTSMIARTRRALNPFSEVLDPVTSDRTTVLSGSNALRAIANILPTLNSGGASLRRVSAAVELIENTPKAAELLLNARQIPNGRFIKHKLDDGVTMRAGNIPATTRLALEMTLHEDDERRAIEGELHELELRWKDAEEIAAIADSMTLTAIE